MGSEQYSVISKSVYCSLITAYGPLELWYYVRLGQSCLHCGRRLKEGKLKNGRFANNLAEVSMNNNATLFDTLLHQAETAAQRRGQPSRLTKQAITRQLERTDDETVARQLDAIYQFRSSRLPTGWRIVQQQALHNLAKW